MSEQIEFEIQLGLFTQQCLWAREVNKAACKRHRIYWTEIPMTPQEELYTKFYNAEALLVEDMSDIELQARREELQNLAIEVRARLTKTINKQDERGRARRPKGFESSINVDETTTEALNAIENRNTRMSKLDKVAKTLREMGVDEAEVQRMLSARNIRDTKAKETSKPLISTPFEVKPIVAEGQSETKEPVKLSNPFAK